MRYEKSAQPNPGHPNDEVVWAGKRAAIALASPPPTREEAIDLTRVLVSYWTGDLPFDRLDAINALWPEFPLAVCQACVHPKTGIVRQRVKNLRSDRLEMRRFVPSNPDLYDWLDRHRGDLTQAVKAGEIAARPHPPPRAAPDLPPRTAEEVARVRAVADAFKARHRGGPTEAELRAQSERYLADLPRYDQ